MKKVDIENLEPRRLYRIRSRNLVVGVWDPEAHGFIGIREKFGSEYPFTEYHWDRRGTVSHMEPTEHVLPPEIPLWEGRSQCEVCGEPDDWVPFDPPPTDRLSPRGEWHHDDRTLDADHAPHSVYVHNEALFDWLKPYDEAELIKRQKERELP